jgi:hypothetical protein
MAVVLIDFFFALRMIISVASSGVQELEIHHCILGIEFHQLHLLVLCCCRYGALSRDPCVAVETIGVDTRRLARCTFETIQLTENTRQQFSNLIWSEFSS